MKLSGPRSGSRVGPPPPSPLPLSAGGGPSCTKFLLTDTLFCGVECQCGGLVDSGGVEDEDETVRSGSLEAVVGQKSVRREPISRGAMGSHV